MINQQLHLHNSKCVFIDFRNEINLQLSMKKFPSTNKRELLHFNHLKIEIKSGQYLAGTILKKMAGLTGTEFPVAHCPRHVWPCNSVGTYTSDHVTTGHVKFDHVIICPHMMTSLKIMFNSVKIILKNKQFQVPRSGKINLSHQISNNARLAGTFDRIIVLNV